VMSFGITAAMGSEAALNWQLYTDIRHNRIIITILSITTMTMMTMMTVIIIIIMRIIIITCTIVTWIRNCIAYCEPVTSHALGGLEGSR